MEKEIKMGACNKCALYIVYFCILDQNTLAYMLFYCNISFFTHNITILTDLLFKFAKQKKGTFIVDGISSTFCIFVFY